MLGIKGALDAGKDVEQKWYERLGVDFSSTNLRPIRGSMYRAIMLSVSKLTGLGNAHQAISKRKSLARIKEADIQAVVACKAVSICAKEKRQSWKSGQAL